MRTFASGATRDSDDTKNDYEGYLSPIVVEAFGDYMTRHRKQADGNLRDSDNWQKGIPIPQYVKSLVRHAIDLWSLHRGFAPKRMLNEMDGATFNEMKREAACAILFNVQGFLHETLKFELTVERSSKAAQDVKKSAA